MSKEYSPVYLWSPLTSTVFYSGAVIKDRSYLSLLQQMCTRPNICSLQSLHSILERRHFLLVKYFVCNLIQSENNEWKISLFKHIIVSLPLLLLPLGLCKNFFFSFLLLMTYQDKHNHYVIIGLILCQVIFGSLVSHFVEVRFDRIEKSLRVGVKLAAKC